MAVALKTPLRQVQPHNNKKLYVTFPQAAKRQYFQVYYQQKSRENCWGNWKAIDVLIHHMWSRLVRTERWAALKNNMKRKRSSRRTFGWFVWWIHKCRVEGLMDLMEISICVHMQSVLLYLQAYPQIQDNRSCRYTLDSWSFTAGFAY